MQEVDNVELTQLKLSLEFAFTLCGLRISPAWIKASRSLNQRVREDMPEFSFAVFFLGKMKNKSSNDF